MSILSNVLNEGKEIDIGNIKIKIYALTNREMLTAMKLQRIGKEEEVADYIIKTTLKKAVPDATDEEIDNLQGQMVNLTDVISELNHIPKPKQA